MGTHLKDRSSRLFASFFSRDLGFFLFTLNHFHNQIQYEEELEGKYH
jgi:hypothetical protein